MLSIIDDFYPSFYTGDSQGVGCRPIRHKALTIINGRRLMMGVKSSALVFRRDNPDWKQCKKKEEAVIYMHK